MYSESDLSQIIKQPESRKFKKQVENKIGKSHFTA